MATQTTNYGLSKPAINDNYDISVQNTNMDKIDAQLKVNADAAAAKQDKTNSLTEETSLGPLDYVSGYDSSAAGHRKFSLGSIETWLKSVFDAIYAPISHTQAASTITDFAAAVRAVVLTGISTATDASIIAADSVLGALGKLQAQVTAHRTNTSNPHGTTPALLGGGNAACTTAAATAAKVATLSNYVLTVGGMLVIEFTYQNTAANVTVACNGAAAKSITVGGVAAKWWQIPLKAVLEYNGTSYNLLNPNTSFKKTATLSTGSWTGSAAPYTYTLSDIDILAADTPHIDRVTGTDAAAAALINTAWGLTAGYAVKPQTAAGTITFYASAIPATNIPIMYEVVRS